MEVGQPEYNISRPLTCGGNWKLTKSSHPLDRLLVVSQIGLRCDKDTWHTGTEVLQFRKPLPLDALEGGGRLNAEADEKCIGVEVTAYRCHPFDVLRGGTIKGVTGELPGRQVDMSHGKGGSMHIFAPSFFGGNGIVGWRGHWVRAEGQVFEAYSMAKLSDFPVVFVCENNEYGMGPSAERSSSNTEYSMRGDKIPGLQVNSMDIIAAQYARRWTVEQKNGPLLLEFVTYRYGGDSMSDPGTTHRTREEVQRMRSTQADPRAAQLDKDAKAEVDAAVEEAKASPEPRVEDLWTDIYYKGTAPPYMRGRERDSLIRNRLSARSFVIYSLIYETSLMLKNNGYAASRSSLPAIAWNTIGNALFGSRGELRYSEERSTRTKRYPFVGDIRWHFAYLQGKYTLDAVRSRLSKMKAHSFTVLDAQPLRIEGGMFVAFDLIARDEEATLRAIHADLEREAETRDGLPVWRVGTRFRLCQGQTDLRRYPSNFLRVSFDGPDIGEEQLYELMRLYGHIHDIREPFPAPAGSLRWASVVFDRTAAAAVARNPIHGLEVWAPGTAAPTTLRILIIWPALGRPQDTRMYNPTESLLSIPTPQDYVPDCNLRDYRYSIY
ncbi:thiamine diphosphate-binding protein [Mycena albidolilacea]|uniref:Thiamine diphosphate-binding protein n=1 Tax=Mycena albidolilacea TaxID=1033008 RepID=A0AAD7AJK7_9AGAR|nr:thiamine diphosphate-binding protein [Mycena albidolilacea]